jgi:hypothetical protein
VLVVTRLDRLARSSRDLLNVLDTITQAVRDCTPPTGRAGRSDHGCEYWRDDYCVDDIEHLDLYDLCRAMAWLGEGWRPWIKRTARWFPVASRM